MMKMNDFFSTLYIFIVMDVNEQFESLMENSTEIDEAVSRTGSSGTIDFDELERKPRISIKYWEKLFKGKVEDIFDGIHGYIAIIRVSTVQKRHESTTFEYLTKGPDYRWIEFDDKYIKIGF